MKITIPINIQSPTGVSFAIGVAEIEKRDGEYILSGVIDQDCGRVCNEELYRAEFFFTPIPACRAQLANEDHIVRGEN